MATVRRLADRARQHADVAFLVLVVLVLSGLNLLWTSHEVANNSAQQTRERAAQLAAQQKQTEHTLKLLCGSFGKLSANMPPAGNPETNPSRHYDQVNHQILAGIGSDLGCNRETSR